MLRESFPHLQIGVTVNERNIAALSGECGSWQELIDVGHAVAHVKGVHNVVSDMTAKGVSIPKKDYTPIITQGKKLGVVEEADVVIIGAGVSGCGVARELAKYDLSITVVEKNDDVATGASKANNGNIHHGQSVKPGTLKAKLNVEGNAMYDKWAEELGFELQRCGSMGVITDESLMPLLEQSLKVARINGVPGVEIVDRERAIELEPGLKNIQEPIAAAIWLPTYGLVEPYKVCVALAENAAENGVRFRFNCAVGDVLTEDGHVTGVITEQGIIKARYVINCAGVYSDEISIMAGDRSHTIHPRKGTIAILDRNHVPSTDAVIGIFSPGKTVKKNVESKGGGMCRTPEWNVLLGPSATEVPDKEDISSTPEDLAYAMGRNQDGRPAYGDIIRFFTGTRPADYMEDFLIEMSPVTDCFINVAAIQSPGLASAPAVARMVEGILDKSVKEHGGQLRPRPGYNPIRRREVEFRHLSREEQDEIIRKNPKYGRIICRCESITEGEILDAIHSPVIPASVDAIKRRTRAGMGRCQGGFCQPRVLEILARELGQEWVDVTLRGRGTNILVKDNRPEEGGEAQ